MEVGVSWSPASSLRLALPCGCWPMRQRGLGAGRLSEGPADERRGVWAGSGRASAGGRRREVGVGKACDGGDAQWEKRLVVVLWRVLRLRVADGGTG